ncbi:putative solute carrier family 12 member 7-like isoform X1 [Sesbania bispinosa]|nr:putative solute carrier family 12 member 7-like isoform X1 [Sesbania bispinosa]
MEFDLELELPIAHFKRNSKKGLHTASTSRQPNIQVFTTPSSSPKRENQRQPIMAGNGDRRTLEDYSQPRPEILHL